MITSFLGHGLDFEVKVRKCGGHVVPYDAAPSVGARCLGGSGTGEGNRKCGSHSPHLSKLFRPRSL